ncbi:MAG: O-antigen ligase family protein [Anaerolineae bacterium]|nr:O-antigen ligase family protein [Anaerolineae bacterium]
MRRGLIFALAVFLNLGSFAVLAVSLLAREEHLYGVVNPVFAESLPFRTPLFGVNAELTSYRSDEELERQLRLMQDAGVTWVRQFVYWDHVELVRGQFDWDGYDRIVDAVSAHESLRLVAVLMNTPEWARDAGSPNDPTSPPADPSDFGRFAAEFASRYAGVVDFVQIWDEPNLYSNWGRLPPRAARYTALLATAYHALHAVNPVVTVISAALAPTIELGPDNISELVYLRDMYALGAGDVMDAAAGKPYGFDFPPDDRRVHPLLLNYSRFAALREVMVENGDSGKPLWGSQWGWNALPGDWRGIPSIWGAVSPGEQIAFTLGALRRAETEWPWVGGMILHHWNPPYPSDHPQQGFSLTTLEGLPTPLLAVLSQQAIPAHASNGWYPARSPDAQYSGVWTFSEIGADIGWLRDSRLRFTFSGSDIALLLRQDDYVAHLYVTVDGRPANALPRDAYGNSYLVLSSGSRSPVFGPVLVAHGLPKGTHVVELVADQGFDRYALVGFAVGSGDITKTFDAWVTGAMFAVIAGVTAVVATARALPFATWNTRLKRLCSALSLPVQATISLVTSLALMLTFAMSLGSPEPPIIRREPILPLIAFLSAGAVYLNVAVPLTIAATLVLFWCISQRLSIGIMLTLFYAPFFLFPVELFRFAIPMVEILALLTIGAWGLQQLTLVARRRQIGAPFALSAAGMRWSDKLALTYVCLGIAAVSWSQYTGFAFTELRVLFVEPVLFYVVIRTARLSEREMRWIVSAIVAAGTVVACVSLLQYIRGEAIITAEDASRRLAGIYGSPNNLALFLGRCLPFCFAALLIARERRTRIVVLAVMLPMMAAVALTQSVGGIFIGLPAAAIAILVVVYGRRATIGLAIVSAVVVVGFTVAASQSDRFARALDFSQGTNFYRVRVMQSAIQAISDRPLTGLGLDQFLYAFRDTYIYPDAWPEPNLSHPHNFLLDFWVRLGIGGVLVVVALLVAGYRLFAQSISRTQSWPFWNWVSVGLMGAFVYTFAHGLLDNSVFVIDLVYIFFAHLAIGCWITARNQSVPAP